MNKRVEVLKSLFMSSFAALLIVFTACGGEGGSILDNLTSDATLKSVELTGVNLCPVFDQGTTNYSVEVPFATESLQLKYSAGTTAIVKIIANGKSVNISDNTAAITIGNKTKVIINST